MEIGIDEGVGVDYWKLNYYAEYVKSLRNTHHR